MNYDEWNIGDILAYEEYTYLIVKLGLTNKAKAVFIGSAFKYDLYTMDSKSDERKRGYTIYPVKPHINIG